MSKVDLGQQILGANLRLADRNRARLKECGVFALNLMSGPGAGKTSLLERTARALAGQARLGVIAGDVQTTQDADRAAAAGLVARPIETRGACHLDAKMVAQELERLPLDELDALIIENVGNLVCPAAFDLGQHARAVMVSVAEGDDKPSKYPAMFRVADVVLVNKIDLLPYIDCSLERIERDARRLQPDARVLALSCKTGEGFSEWTQWLLERVQQWKAGAP